MVNGVLRWRVWGKISSHACPVSLFTHYQIPIAHNLWPLAVTPDCLQITVNCEPATVNSSFCLFSCNLLKQLYYLPRIIRRQLYIEEGAAEILYFKT